VPVVTVVVGVDGAGRTYRLGRLADDAGTRAWWVGSGDLASGLASATLVVADDAHRLAPEVLRALTAAARTGVRVLMSRRPTIDSPELADLDEAAAADGVELLIPLTPDEVGTLVAVVTGRPVSPEIAAAVHEASAGLPGVAAAVASTLPTGPAPAGPRTKPGRSAPGAMPGSAGQRAGSGGTRSGSAPGGTGSATRPSDADSGATPHSDTRPGDASAGSNTGQHAGPSGTHSSARPGSTSAGSSGVRSASQPGGGSGAVAGVPVLDVVAPALMARVQRRFAVLPRQVGAVARVLALRLDLADSVLAAAAEVPAADLPGVLRTLRDEGMLIPGRPTAGERMIPAVADAVLGDLSSAERRRLHDVAAGALAAAGADPLVTAAQLRAARVRTPAAAGVYRQAGELTRFTDPAAALAWFDDATEAGAAPSDVVAGRAEASTLLGLAPDADLPTPPGSDAAARLSRLAGAAAAHDGRADRAAELLLAAPPPGPLLAVPVLVGAGRLADATACARDGSPSAMRLAEAVLVAARDPDAAVPLLIEAAEVSERVTPVAVLPDTPHAIGAVVAVLAGDVAGAEHLLTGAGVGGPVAAERHRLLLAWARMRAGRYDTALAELVRPAGELPARERLLRAAIAAGMARRRGDIAGLRSVWASVEPVLTRRTVDLWQLEPMEELLVAAARLRQGRRVEPILDILERTVDQLGRPPAWAAALGWLRVQVAVASDDPDTATTQARRLAEISEQATRPSGHVDHQDTAATQARRLTETSEQAARPTGHDDNQNTTATQARRLAETSDHATPPAGHVDHQDAAAIQARRLAEISEQAARPTRHDDNQDAAATQARRPAETSQQAARPTGHDDNQNTTATQARQLTETSEQAARPTGHDDNPPRQFAESATGRPAGQHHGPATTPGSLGHRAAAQCAAATLWAQLLANTPPPPDAVLDAADQLVAAQLPWEASRLAGQAAIHATDPVVVRRLLERARELSEPDSPIADAQTSGLSERELAVAQLVVAGSTHREIGAQLYIAPKTVEHHVARIRAKLGAGSRAELLAMLREILADPA
jgi:DNA-binding CsgD family transcriptional regulator